MRRGQVRTLWSLGVTGGGTAGGKSLSTGVLRPIPGHLGPATRLMLAADSAKGPYRRSTGRHTCQRLLQEMATGQHRGLWKWPPQG